MKKSAIAVKLLIAAMTITAASCSGSDKDSDSTAVAPVAKAAVKDNGTTPTTNIRYVDMDSILSQYTLAQEISQAGQKLMLDYQRLERQKQSEIQSLGNAIEQKRNNSGYLSQESFDADVNNFNKKQNEAANLLTAQQNKIQNEIATQQKRLTDSIMNYVKEYNVSHGYDAILLRDAGIYFNPALDITEDIVAGLNKRYTPAAKSEK
jgi:outer membrane protein